MNGIVSPVRRPAVAATPAAATPATTPEPAATPGTSSNNTQAAGRAANTFAGGTNDAALGAATGDPYSVRRRLLGE